MERSDVELLRHGGNWAVTHLPDRNFPGLHVQGDTFAELRGVFLRAARTLRERPGDADALDDLDHGIRDMTEMLEFYERTLAERGLSRPYFPSVAQAW
ncbi:hypothetical protein Cs7R123_16620 [Catellatospora sp. TT07R-123]|uniref:DUF6959 family protein n=1 Tax=Catellatospora sp. TT07R-123 TaxID=2733863 RepID=UPI001B2B45D3|nr:hypothetical protein [Catellatospora sp. TT07R-123]GHJ44320.1 hypothetical protein Cs7R123_16620 [Catellatospora sp. TT07R-123]